MKNKIEWKKCLIRMGVLLVLFSGAAMLVHTWEWTNIQREYNRAVTQILAAVREDYPDVSSQELIRIFNGNERTETDAEQMLETYGIFVEKDAVIQAHERQKSRYMLLWAGYVLLCGIGIGAVFFSYNWEKDRQLAEITKYLEKINRKNYSLELESMTEDELSMLKTEIYKTTVMLKEAAENSQKDKANLKDAMSDISHQMKTPLTSIRIILDDLIDDPEMEPEVRQDFIRDVKREISHIQFLVQSLLKMTRLDAGTVSFLRKEVSLTHICEEAMKNVSTLCDLKNVRIQTDFADGDMIFCDPHWQAEAITNILKNCAEQAPEGSSLILRTEKNQLYGSVSITDFGAGIGEEEKKHLFERFYRGKNASAEGVGIGLSLAKTIVEQDNGKIFVESDEKKTTFEVKYF